MHFKKPRLYDTKCYDLAQHFLQDYPKGMTTDVDAAELAAEIQMTVEDFCQELNERLWKKQPIKIINVP